MFAVPLEATFISEKSKHYHWLACSVLLVWTFITWTSEKRHKCSPKHPKNSTERCFFVFQLITVAIVLTFYSHSHYVTSIQSRSVPSLISWSGVLLQNLPPSVTQQTVRTILNPTVHSTVHTSPPPVRTLSHINSPHAIQTQFPNIHNMTTQHNCTLSIHSLSITFPHQTPYAPSIYHKVATCPSMNFLLIWWTKLLVFCRECRSWNSSLCSRLHSPVIPSLTPQYLTLPARYFRKPSAYFPLYCERKFIFPYILIFTFLESILEGMGVGIR
jgi:hypothetical protein